MKLGKIVLLGIDDHGKIEAWAVVDQLIQAKRQAMLFLADGLHIQLASVKHARRMLDAQCRTGTPS